MIVNNEATKVDIIIKDVDVDNMDIFSLSGQRLQAPKKGINFIGGRKVVIK